MAQFLITLLIREFKINYEGRGHCCDYCHGYGCEECYQTGESVKGDPYL